MAVATTRRALFGQGLTVAGAGLLAAAPFGALASPAADEWAPLEAYLTAAHRDGASVIKHIRAATNNDWASWEHAYDTSLLRAAMKPDMVRGIVLTAHASGDALTVLFSTPTTGPRHPNVQVDKDGARPRCGGVWFV